jgi:hypothetical protein
MRAVLKRIYKLLYLTRETSTNYLTGQGFEIYTDEEREDFTFIEARLL